MNKINSQVRHTFILIFIISCVYFPFIHYSDTHEASVIRNSMNGEVSISTKSGFSVTSPWLSVAKMDLRPTRVCIETTARVVNCKLVKFKSDTLSSFVKREGFKYYWLSNRFSFNSGYEDEYRGVRDYLRAYAFSPVAADFIEVIDEYYE